MSNYKFGEIYHHGVKGQKWGVRRYQNPDGTLTSDGIKRYAKKQYAKEEIGRSKTKLSKLWNKYAGGANTYASALYGASSRKENERAAYKYANSEKRKEISKLKEDKKRMINGLKADLQDYIDTEEYTRSLLGNDVYDQDIISFKDAIARYEKEYSKRIAALEKQIINV